MGLDVYFGPLTRYYAGNWETILQQVEQESGVPVRVIRPSQPVLGWFGQVIDFIRPRGPAATAKAVRRWRDHLRNELGLMNLDWNEDPDKDGGNLL